MASTATGDALGIEFATPEGLGASAPALMLERMTNAMRRANGSGNRPGRVAWRILEAIYRQEPLVQRGIKKHAGDLVKQGFTITEPGKEDAIPEDEDFRGWMRSVNLDSVTYTSLVYAHVYGTGILEVEWDDGGGGLDPVQNGSLPVAFYVVDPAYCDFEVRQEDGRAQTFLVQRAPGADQVVLHPDRYHAFKFTTLPGYEAGLSTIETAYHTAISKVKADQALGESVFFSSQPKLHAKIRQAKEGESEAVAAMLSSPDFSRAFVWDDRLDLTQLNPSTLDPLPFYEVFLQSLAAAIGLPKMMLEGAQAGRISGSETNLADYHSDLRQVQVMVLEPFYTRIIMAKVGVTADVFDLRWNEQPVGKSAEAKSALDQATAFQLLTASGISPLAAARIVGLDVTEEDLIEQPVAPNVLPPPPGGNPVPPIPPGGQKAFPPAPQPLPPIATPKP